MTNYAKSVNFAVKDTLTSGDPNKIVSGAEIDTEFNNIASASTTKIDKVPAAGTGNVAKFTATGAIEDTGSPASALIPSGGIIMWSGLIASIPTGWALCDGNNGTPDLRNRFIVGAGDTYDRNDTGGSTTTSTDGSHTHTTDTSGAHDHGGSTEPHQLTIAEMPSHTHGLDRDSNYERNGGNSSTDFAGTSAETGATGGDQPHSHGISSSGSEHSHNVNANGDHNHEIIPPYFALAFIMKL